jgi:pyrroloquinoline quinone biosynthesis protein B
MNSVTSLKLVSQYFLIAIVLFSCKDAPGGKQGDLPKKQETTPQQQSVSLVVLGTVQDAGSPQIACEKACCKDLFNNPDPTRKVVALGVIDHEHKKSYLLEATPDIGNQIKALDNFSPSFSKPIPDGIFLTHAHIGHYTGLIYIGYEALNATKMAVYAMPKMKSFLSANGPWDQLIHKENIVFKHLEDAKREVLSPSLAITPLLVPHRDEYSETVGYIVEGVSKKALFIPDIDKWARWDKKIADVISGVDYAFVDATFYDAEEINHRDISEIPHPFVIESMTLFDGLPADEKKKIHFIHLNHTNPLLNKGSKQFKEVLSRGYNVAEFHQIIAL